MSILHRELLYKNPQLITFDKNNPRGLTEDQIVGDPNFDKLVASIKKYGILEPLIVKKDESNSNLYILIDGERRLRAALLSEQTEVPLLVASDDTDGRILAYQVHMLRNNWGKPAETKAIKKIIADLKEEYPGITDDDIKKKIIEITAHKQHELADILKLIKYDDEIIEAVITNKLDMSYLVQIQASFITPVKKHYPAIISKHSEEEIRKIMVQKALDGKLINTRFLMDKFKVVFTDKDNKKKEEIERLLLSFLEKKGKTIKDALKKYDELNKPLKKKEDNSSKKATRRSKKLLVDVKESSKEIFGYKKIRVTRKQLTSIDDIREKFEIIGSTFSAEEREYIAEALFCLERHCFKAATLMIWASGISRILNYISKNLADFNKATLEMAANPKSVYKHYAKSFQKNAQSIEDIRINSNDRQVVSYLLYKKYVTETECKKLLADYSTRCDCAHPTDIKISPNQAITIFESVYDLILNNSKIS